jgi:GTP-binding protein Era
MGHQGGASDREWEEVFESFEDLEAEVNYRKARETLRQLLDRLDLTPRERQGLTAEIDGLTAMLRKLDRETVCIAAFGMVGRGKSSVLNGLLGDDRFETGALHGVTRAATVAQWCPQGAGAGLPAVELIDTPGIDEVADGGRAAIAAAAGRRADLILFVIAGDMTTVECDALSELRAIGKPILLVFNKIDRYPEADRDALYRRIVDERVRELISPDEIVLVAAAPLRPVGQRRPDGTVAVELRRGAAQIEPLKLKILEVLQREGKALAALNAMLYAHDAHDRILARKLQVRDRAANRLLWNGTIAKAAAVAINPIVVLDLLGGAAIDTATILALSHLYGIPMTQRGATALLQKIAIAMGGLGAGELLLNLGLGTLKGIFGLSAAATGGLAALPYTSVAIAQAGMAGYGSYAIAQAAKLYFANDASWGPDGPRAAVGRILTSLDERAIIKRIEQELARKLAGRFRRAPDPDWI